MTDEEIAFLTAGRGLTPAQIAAIARYSVEASDGAKRCEACSHSYYEHSWSYPDGRQCPDYSWMRDLLSPSLWEHEHYRRQSRRAARRRAKRERREHRQNRKLWRHLYGMVAREKRARRAGAPCIACPAPCIVDPAPCIVIQAPCIVIQAPCIVGREMRERRGND